MFIKRFFLSTTLVLSGAFALVIGLINCGGGGGGDPKPNPPPPEVTYTVPLNPTQGITANPATLTGKNGETKTSNIVLPTGYTNPIATPAGTFTNGITAGSYVLTVVITPNLTTINISATPPSVPLYKVSGQVTGINFSGLTMTLLSTGKSVLTDADGKYTFYAPTGNDTITPSVPVGVKVFPLYRNFGVNNADSVGNDFKASLVDPTEMVISILYYYGVSGRQVCLVIARSIAPVELGDVHSSWIKKPGESEFVQWYDPLTIDSGFAGGYLTHTLYNAEDFFDTLPDGTKVYWKPGIAKVWKQIKKPSGVTLSVFAEIPVPGDPNRVFGSLEGATFSIDGNGNRIVQLFGNFINPVVELYKIVGTLYFGVTMVPQNGIIVIPSDMFGLKSPITLVSGPPDNRVSSTGYVDIPPPQ